MRRWPWSVLDIDPTNDVSVVRSGYATVLRSFEPDDDPARYAALRQARDSALHMARAEQALAEPDEDDDEDWDDTDWDEPVVDSQPFRAPTNGATPATPPTRAQAAIDAHYAALAALLRPADNAAFPPDLDEAETMRRHCAAILADPRMDQITFRANADDHFLYLLADCVPRSDPILPMVAEHFGWAARRGRLGQPPVLDWLLAHADDVRARSPLFDAETAHFRASLENPSDENFHIWRDLTGVANEGERPPRIKPKSVVALLQTIQSYYPPLMAAVDPSRLAHWQQAAATAQNRKNRWAMVGCFIFMVLALSLAKLFPDPPRPALPAANPDAIYADQPLTTPRKDIGRALLLIGDGVSVDTIRASNAKLWAILGERWADASKRQVPAVDFINATATYLHGLFGSNLGRASRADLTEYWRLEIVHIRQIKAAGADQCPSYVAGTTPALPPGPAEAARMRRLEAKLLTDVPYAPPAETSRKYVIPGEIVVRAAKRAGLPTAAFGEALRGKGAPGAVCDARIGLAETVIETPGKVGDKLLRSM